MYTNNSSNVRVVIYFSMIKCELTTNRCPCICRTAGILANCYRNWEFLWHIQLKNLNLHTNMPLLKLGMCISKTKPASVNWHLLVVLLIRETKTLGQEGFITWWSKLVPNYNGYSDTSHGLFWILDPTWQNQARIWQNKQEYSLYIKAVYSCWQILHYRIRKMKTESYLLEYMVPIVLISDPSEANGPFTTMPKLIFL